MHDVLTDSDVTAPVVLIDADDLETPTTGQFVRLPANEPELQSRGGSSIYVPQPAAPETVERIRLADGTVWCVLEYENINTSVGSAFESWKSTRYDVREMENA